MFTLPPGFLCVHLTYAVIILNSVERNKFNYFYISIDQSVNICYTALCRPVGQYFQEDFYEQTREKHSDTPKDY